MFVAIAYAVEGGQGAASSQLVSFMPLILIFAIFYFLLIRPQQKKGKEHSKFLEALKAGDEVVTSGGIYGKISKIDGKDVVIEVADKVKLKIVRSHLYPQTGA